MTQLNAAKTKAPASTGKGSNRKTPLRLEDFDASVFVVTYGRSGSTLIQNLLNKLDGYCIRGENANAIAPLAQSWHQISANPTIQSKRQSGKKTTSRIPWFGAEHIDPDAYGRALAEVFLRRIMAPPRSARVIGFKEIRWAMKPDTLMQSIDFIRAHFPNPKFVFNTRDLASVAKSGWWARMDPKEVIAKLSGMEREFKVAARALGERCVTLRYDDYTADHAAFRPMFDLIGEPWDPELVRSVMDVKLNHLKGAKAPDKAREAT